MLFLFLEPTHKCYGPSRFSSVQPLRVLALLLTSPGPITSLLSCLHLRVLCHRVHAKDAPCLSSQEQTKIARWEQKRRKLSWTSTACSILNFDSDVKVVPLDPIGQKKLI